MTDHDHMGAGLGREVGKLGKGGHRREGRKTALMLQVGAGDAEVGPTERGQKDKEHANRAEEDMKCLLGLFMAV